MMYMDAFEAGFSDAVILKSAQPGMPLRIDPHINRLIRKNGLDRGCLRISAPQGVYLSAASIDTPAELLKKLLSTMELLPEGSPYLISSTLMLPVNLGRLVLGDRQQLFALDPVLDADEAFSLRISYVSSDTILKLTECRIGLRFGAVPVKTLIERELNDAGYKGLVTISIPDPDVVCALLPVDEGRRNALLDGFADHVSTLGVTPDSLGVVFGQWMTLDYSSNSLVLPDGMAPYVIELAEISVRRDIYILQWNRSLYS